jgi:hypothetical protein
MIAVELGNHLEQFVKKQIELRRSFLNQTTIIFASKLLAIW